MYIIWRPSPPPLLPHLEAGLGPPSRRPRPPPRPPPGAPKRPCTQPSCPAGRSAPPPWLTHPRTSFRPRGRGGVSIYTPSLSPTGTGSDLPRPCAYSGVAASEWSVSSGGSDPLCYPVPRGLQSCTCRPSYMRQAHLLEEGGSSPGWVLYPLVRRCPPNGSVVAVGDSSTGFVSGYGQALAGAHPA